MAELAAAPLELETNTAQFNQPELTPMQRFARPLYAAGLAVRDRVDNAKQYLGGVLGSNVDHAVDQVSILATATKEMPSIIGEKISRNRAKIGAALTAGALLSAPSLGVGEAQGPTPVTPIVPPQPKMHYMSVDSKKLANIITGYQKEGCAGKDNILAVAPKTKPARKKIGYLSATFKENKPPTAHFIPAKGAVVCGPIAYTVDGKHAIVPTFKKGWFKDVNPTGSKLAVQYIDMYAHTKTSKSTVG